MIMPIAIAKDGFIDMEPNSETSLQGLLDNLKFEDKDLQFFDGNTCRLINAYDPTNSIFIYENEQGKFLYTITSATPLIHKNKKIWLCNCYEMENLNEYNNLVKPGETFKWGKIQVYNGKYESVCKYPVKIKVKDNFKTMEKYQVPIDEGIRYFTLKIKCLTNPTTLDLKTEAPDGSFNFLFPMRIEESENLEIEKFTTILTNSNNTQRVSLYEIISKYLPNIKSIELIPFDVHNIGNETITYDVLPVEDAVSLGVTGGTYTDCGIFIKNNYSFTYEALEVDFTKLPNFDAKDLIFGGGIRGFLQTPLGNIQLDFNSELYEDLPNARFLIKPDGWKIDGKFKCDIPPHYLNFYTDNAGQIFIQNLTTNAQELRQINRDKIFKEEQNQQNFINSSLRNATGFISNLATGNVAGAFGNIGNVANAGVESELNKISIEREYNKSLAEFRDKQATESLLASMTGKELNGQFSLIDFLQVVNNKYFCLFFETNFIKNNFGIVCQPDYDYSIDVSQYGYSINHDYMFTSLRNNINYLLSFRRFVICEDLNLRTQIRFSRQINLFLRITDQKLI